MSRRHKSRLPPGAAPDPPERDKVTPPSAKSPYLNIARRAYEKPTGSLLVHPRYRDRLARLGLTRVDQFLALPGLIVGGHVDRNVSRVQLGNAGGLQAFMKREHCRPWKGTLVNFLSGFGWIGRSRREAIMLNAASQAGVPVPDWLAVGADKKGRSFLLVRAVENAVDLRTHLENTSRPRERRSFARRLGAELARMHDAGFEHRDLFSNHVLIDADGRIQIIDWQRATRSHRLSWTRRQRELACLDATLACTTASRSDRLACLCAYAAEARLPLRRRVLPAVIAGIRRQSRRLLAKRFVREIRHGNAAEKPQNLIWLDGEACCVTPAFLAHLSGRLPDWLEPLVAKSKNARLPAVPDQRDLHLVQRTTSRPFAWLFSLLRRKPVRSEELQHSVLLFRLERQGVLGPRLLAFGQKFLRPWRTDSFLLTESAADVVPLLDWLKSRPAPRDRRRLLLDLGKLLHKLHDADCRLESAASIEGLKVRVRAGAAPQPMFTSFDGFVRARPRPRHARRDLRLLARLLKQGDSTRSDLLRFLIGYRDSQKPDRLDRKLFALLDSGGR